MDRGLTRRRLALAALEHVAHDDFVDRAVGHRRAHHGFADDERAEARAAHRR